MNTYLITIVAILATAFNHLNAEQPSGKKPPVGVPADATLFNGKWYRVYLEAISWKGAKVKCERLGGQLAVVPDAPTEAFIQQLANNLVLWLGASEKVEGLWQWVDGTPMKYTAWVRGEPDNNGSTLDVLATWKGGWADNTDNPRNAVGYICEWKAK